MRSSRHSFLRRFVLLSMTGMTLGGTIANGSNLPSRTVESIVLDSTVDVKGTDPIQETEFFDDRPDHYQYSSLTDNVTHEETSSPLKWYSMITNIPRDWSSFVKNTFRSENIPTIAGVAGLTGILYLEDNRTYRDMDMYANKYPHLRTWNTGFVDLGDGKYEFGFIGVMAAYGFAASDSRTVRTASQMSEAILATGVVVQLLKHISGRESPIAATSQRGVIRPFPSISVYQHNQPRYYSFPSGHIATTAASLAVLNANFSDVEWMRPLSYLTLGAVGASLVSKGMHWYSDLPLGIALGYSFGSIAARPEIPELGADNRVGLKSYELSLAPEFSSGAAGLNISLHF